MTKIPALSFFFYRMEERKNEITRRIRASDQRRQEARKLFRCLSRMLDNACQFYRIEARFRSRCRYRVRVFGRRKKEGLFRAMIKFGIVSNRETNGINNYNSRCFFPFDFRFTRCLKIKIDIENILTKSILNKNDRYLYIYKTTKILQAQNPSSEKSVRYLHQKISTSG